MKRKNSNNKIESCISWVIENSSRSEGPDRDQPEASILADQCLINDFEHQVSSQDDPASQSNSTNCELHVKIPADGGEPVVTIQGCSCKGLKRISEAIMDDNKCNDEDDEETD